MDRTHLVASLDQIHIVYALYLDVHLQCEAFHALRLAEMDLRRHDRVPRLFGLACLAGNHLDGTEETRYKTRPRSARTWMAILTNPRDGRQVFEQYDFVEVCAPA